MTDRQTHAIDLNICLDRLLLMTRLVVIYKNWRRGMVSSAVYWRLLMSTAELVVIVGPVISASQLPLYVCRVQIQQQDKWHPASQDIATSDTAIGSLVLCECLKEKPEKVPFEGIPVSVLHSDELKKVSGHIKVLRCLVGRSWVRNQSSLSSLYYTYAQSCTLYCASSWLASTAVNLLLQLESQHLARARILTGCTRSTVPTVPLLTYTGLLPLPTWPPPNFKNTLCTTLKTLP